MKYPFILTAATILAGCVSHQSTQPFWMVKDKPVSYFADQVRVTQTEFDACASIETPFYLQYPRVFMSQSNTQIEFKLHANDCGSGINKDHHYLYLSLTYSGGWRFYNAVTDTDAKSYRLTEVSRDVNGCEASIGVTNCSYTEDVNILLPYAKLEQAAVEGLKLRLTGKSVDKTIIDIPAKVIQGYLDGVKNSQKK